MHIVPGVSVSAWCPKCACEVPVGGEGCVPVRFSRVSCVRVFVGDCRWRFVCVGSVVCSLCGCVVRYWPHQAHGA
jgi:hypothetical protein